jgi:hypothetical protein
MQTLNIDGTTYKVKFDRDPLELEKLARKPYKPKKPKDYTEISGPIGPESTAEYMRQFDALQFPAAVDYIGAKR